MARSVLSPDRMRGSSGRWFPAPRCAGATARAVALPLFQLPHYAALAAVWIVRFLWWIRCSRAPLRRNQSSATTRLHSAPSRRCFVRLNSKAPPLHLGGHLGGHFKTGQRRRTRTKSIYTLPEPLSSFGKHFSQTDQASLYWLHLNGGYGNAGKRPERRFSSRKWRATRVALFDCPFDAKGYRVVGGD